MKILEEKKEYMRNWHLANKVNRDIKKNFTNITLELSMDF